MKEALLYQKLTNNSVRCQVCQRRCVIAEGQLGYCQTRLNKKGKLHTTIYGLVSSINNDPIEKKPVFHYQPGSCCLSLGSFGCNFKCQFCQNWEIAFARASEIKSQNAKFKISPEKVIETAKKNNSEGIAITYNEPVIWLEYSLEVFKLVKKITSDGGRVKRSETSDSSEVKKSLYTCWVTNGYATKEAIDLIAPYLDIYRVDLKSFEDKFYQKLINVQKAQAIFTTTKYVHDQYPKIHLECVTNIIPTWNDAEENLKKIAFWIGKNLGKQTPWHVTRFYPDAQLTNVPPTPAATLFKAREIGLKAGLEFVYIGNFAVDKEDDTFCPKCKKLVIKRDGYQVEIIDVTSEGKCQFCGYQLNVILQLHQPSHPPSVKAKSINKDVFNFL